MPIQTNDKRASLVLMLAILLGAWLRFTPAAQAEFPVNDGGMFYTMIGDLQADGYALPAFTTYNRAENIPFAYPPFPLYLAALLVGIFHFSVTQLLLWLPALTSVAVIVTFYFFAQTLLDSRPQAALAALFFALTPRTFSWFLMGGGLTRSFGQLFLMLTATSAFFLFTRRKSRYLALTMLCGALAVLSHPEAGIHTAGIALLIWGFKARNWKTLLDGVKVSLGVIVITALWWLPVISWHGITPLLNAAQTGNHSLRAWASLLTFNFTEEPLLGLIAVLGLLGLFASLVRRDYFFAAWFILPYLLEPRSAPWIVTMPLTMLAAIACADLLLPGLAALGKPVEQGHCEPPVDSWRSGNPPLTEKMSFMGGLLRQEAPRNDIPMQGKPALLFLGFVTVFSLFGSYAFALRMGADRLSLDDRAAMAWISENMPSESRFIILTGAQDPMRDPIQEWFPALAERGSQTTLQGREWTWGKRFIESLPGFGELANCIERDVKCVESQAQKLGIDFDALYIKKQLLGSCAADKTCQYNSWNLVNEIKELPGCEIVYENNTTIVATFEKSANP